MSSLTRTWLALALFSVATTLVALSALPAPFSGALILTFAWAKARLIFLQFLELADVPGWRFGILVCLTIFFAVLFSAYLYMSTAQAFA